ncbi:hypothetical protein J0A68_07520 [Algoriphagus sp. H41]|uniref:Secreted protein n=1 Tax=Algoriphagus oliviformis TaxID=2811231 RepID=A0ABS3C1G8_9BACT|nr:hypothetical protein [Algoriphagus oliviformis]MBN7810798.1 hypothetical protein [Algoriphagus oliviformis]
MIFFAALCSFMLFASLLSLVLTLDSKTSKCITRLGRNVKIWHPLKTLLINVDTDLKGWRLTSFKLPGLGKIYSLKLEFRSGNAKTVYSRTTSSNLHDLVYFLERNAGDRRRTAA